MPSGDPFQRWRIANRKAAGAADAMFAKLVLAVDAGGEPPSKSEADEVSRLRRIANDELAAALLRVQQVLPSATARRASAATAPR